MIISKFKRELNGDISEITLNTKEVLKNTKYYTGEGTTKLYVWKYVEEGTSFEYYLMTATETLTEDTKVFVNDNESGTAFATLRLVENSDYRFTENGIEFKTHGSEEYDLYTRSSSDDIDLF